LGLNHNVDLLKPVNAVLHQLDTSKTSSPECSLVRYITNSITAYSIDGVFPWLDIKVHGVPKVFEKFSAYYSVMLVHTDQVLEKGQLDEFCFRGVRVHQKQPWPPLSQLEMQSVDTHLRPSPWPPFCGYSVDMLWESVFGLFQLSQHAILVGLGYCPLQEKMQWVMHIASTQFRSLPWPSFGTLPAVLQLENFLMSNCMTIVIPMCSDWHISGCSAISSCQVLAFSWSPSVHVYFELIVSQYTLQAIVVIGAIGLSFWSTSATLGISIDAADMLLQTSSFISWVPMCWMLIPHSHELVRWKLSWISVQSVINLLSVDLNGLKVTIPSQARNPCNILQPPNYMPLIHWRDITIVSASSVWEVVCG
jgi:hypothetical protein